jgi:phosphoenolpyruvate-protein phosphotransferase
MENSLELLAPMAGWISPLSQVPDEAFASGLLGAGVALDPLEDTVCAPCAGEVLAVHSAGHAVTLRLGAGLDLLLHFGLDTVRMGGDGFTPQVRVGQMVAAGEALLRVDVAKVVLHAKSLIMPMILIEAEGWQWHPVLQDGRVAKGDLLGRLTGAGAQGDGDASNADWISRHLRVPLAYGLHARPSARLAQVAKGFSAKIRVEKGDNSAAITSPSALLRLGVGHGDAVRLLAQGDEAEVALDALADLIASGMGEFRQISDAEAARAQTVAQAPQAGDRLCGVMAAPGMALGYAWRPVRPEPDLGGSTQGAAIENARFAAAWDGLRADLAAQAGQGGAEQRAILEAHLAILDDEDLLALTRAGIAQGANAAQAWRQVMWQQADALRALADPRFAERAGDLLDLELRLQWQLCGGQPDAPEPPVGAILIADDLMPSEVAALDLSRVVGLATARGGPTSHVAIIAASRGLPALVALGEAVLALADGTDLVLDADGGGLEIAPDAQRLADVKTMIAARAQRRAAALAMAGEQGRTRDGVRIEVFANLGKLAEVAPALAQGAEGCGLLRTEFLFLDRQNAPDEDEQFAQYRDIALGLGRRPLVIRLLDIGGDKPAPYLPIAAEENPAMGLRGLRVGLARPDVLRTQLRAILRAAVGHDIKIMAPMVARLAEWHALRSIAVQEAEALGVAVPEMGVMVETPAAAVMADALAAHCAFLSIGTNDLTQYALAMDRGNPAVAGGLDGMDPAVLRLVSQTCAGGARHGKWVGVCGGLASDPLAVPILLGLGVSELSAAPAVVAEIKALVRGLDLGECRALAQRALCAESAAQVRFFAGEFIGRMAL